MKKNASKLIALTLVFMLGVSSVFADSCLVLKMKSGETTSFILADQPHITFPNGQFIIKTAKAEATFALKDVERFYFADIDLGIEAVGAQELRFTYLNGIVTVEGVAGSVCVIDTFGRIIKTVNPDAQDRVVIDMSAAVQAEGVYLIKVGERSIKVRR